MIDNKVEEIKKLMDQVMNVLEIPRTESNENTPLRIAKMLCNEVFVNRNDRNIEELGDKMKTFPNEYESGLVILKDIEFSSMCEHHWLPFIGKVTVGYVPSDTIVGLSKIPRVVKYYSKRPQLQEQLTTQIGDYLFGLLKPKAVFVEITAMHTCVLCRGAESHCETTTSFQRYSNNMADANKKKWYDEFKTRMR